MNGPKLAGYLSGSCVALCVLCILFRGLIYSRIPMTHGEAFGLADIIEFFLGCLLLVVMGVSGLAVVAMIVRGPHRNRVAAGWLLSVNLAVLALLPRLHTVVARWAAGMPLGGHLKTGQSWTCQNRPVEASQYKERVVMLNKPLQPTASGRG